MDNKIHYKKMEKHFRREADDEEGNNCSRNCREENGADAAKQNLKDVILKIITHKQIIA